MSERSTTVQPPGRAKLGHWRSLAGQQAYEQAYATALKRLPPPSRSRDVPTGYGAVRVYEWVTEQTRSATPIILLPGYTSGVPMWENNLPDLIIKRPVYALDALGDCGMSVQTAVIKNAADQAAWLDQVLTHLNAAQLHVVGHSFGGWSAANYATRHPQKVASLSLLEPVFVFQGLNLRIFLKAMFTTLPFLPERWRENVLKDIGGVTEIDLNDPVARMIAAGSEHFQRQLPAPARITPQQLQGWKMPVYVALASKSSLHNASKAIQVARANVEHIQAKNWPNATHSLPMEYPTELNAELLAFMDRV